MNFSKNGGVNLYWLLMCIAEKQRSQKEHTHMLKASKVFREYRVTSIKILIDFDHVSKYFFRKMLTCPNFFAKMTIPAFRVRTGWHPKKAAKMNLFLKLKSTRVIRLNMQ